MPSKSPYDPPPVAQTKAERAAERAARPRVPAPRLTRGTIAIGAVLAIAVGVAGSVFAPHALETATDRTGDAELSAWLADNAPNGTEQLTAAVVTPDGVVFAGLGADEHTEVEIGSVSKTVTSLLLAQAVERGEVALDDPLGDHLDLGDAAAADATLEDLASHRSGLPRLASGLGATAASLLANYRAGDPYPFDRATLTEHVSDAATTDAGTVAYSNLGVAALGQALTNAAGTDPAAGAPYAYAELAEERVFGPLGMSDTSVPTTADRLGDDPTRGFTASGRTAAPWTMQAYAPAGGVRSTAADMARYAQALLTDDEALGAPAATVLEPRFDAGEGMRIGLAWFTSANPVSAAGAEGTDDAGGDDAAGAEPSDGPTITWHDGGTGGYNSMLVLDRASGTAVFVNGDTTASVAELAFTLLDDRTSLEERTAR